jgi:leader peptidase (prepilin peptidase) / N-methyltransferase
VPSSAKLVLDLLAQSPLAFIAAASAVGLVVGSFLNVVVYRLPIMLERQWQAQCAPPPHPSAAAPAGAPQPPFNLVLPRSCCPACRAPISAMHNIPLLSYLALRGRCAHCQAKISLRYPAIELLSALSTAVVA